MSSPLPAKSKIRIADFKCAKCDQPLNDVIISENKWSTRNIQCKSCKTNFDVCPSCTKLSLSGIDRCPHCDYLWNYVHEPSPIYYSLKYAICPQCDRLIEYKCFYGSKAVHGPSSCNNCSCPIDQVKFVSGKELQKRLKKEAEDERRRVDQDTRIKEELRRSLEPLIIRVKQMYKDPFRIIYEEDKSENQKTNVYNATEKKKSWLKRLWMSK
jgi:hypothetical protein